MRNLSLTLPLIGICLSSPLAEAATLLNNSSSGTTVASVDLSSYGTTNWAAWNTRSNTLGTEGFAPFATKSGGIGTISPVTFAGDSSNARGTTSLGAYPATFSWTTADATGGIAAPGDGILTGIFAGTVADTGSGVTFNITNLPPLTGGQNYLVSVMTTTFRGTATLTATSGVLTPPGQTTPTHGETKSTEVSSFLYNPDLATDSVAFTLIHTSASGSSHSAIQAVAISIIPEPSTALLALGGMMAATFRRRRH